MKKRLVLIISALSCLFAACDKQNRSNERGGESNSKMDTSVSDAGKEIMGKIGLSFPPGTKIEYAEYMAGQDDAARLVVILPEAQWQAMVEHPPFDKAIFSPDNKSHLDSDNSGWTPSKEPSISVAQIPWANGRQSLNIGVAEARAGTVKVYIFWYQL